MGLGRDCLFKLLRSYLEHIFSLALNDYGSSLAKMRKFDVRNPIRSRNDYLIALLKKNLENIGKTLFCAGRNNDLIFSIFEVVFAFEFRLNRLYQIFVTGNGTVKRKILVDCFFCCRLNVVGSKKIRLTDSQIHYVNALLFEFGTFLAHCKSLRLSNIVDS